MRLLHKRLLQLHTAWICQPFLHLDLIRLHLQKVYANQLFIGLHHFIVCILHIFTILQHTECIQSAESYFTKIHFFINGD